MSTTENFFSAAGSATGAGPGVAPSESCAEGFVGGKTEGLPASAARRRSSWRLN
ncbi:MAG: hypothetical protein ACRELY_32755 [Polyangiaceae bacterium]